MKTAIVYGSGFTGHTRKIAEYLAKRTGSDAFNIKLVENVDLTAYDRVIIGTNVHAGHPNKAILRFTNENKDVISTKSPKLFISCMYKAEKGANQAKKIAEQFAISDYIYFPTGEEKNSSGMPAKIEDFISKL